MHSLNHRPFRRLTRHASRMTQGGPRPRPVNYLARALLAFQKAIRARRRLMRLAPRVFDPAVVDREAAAGAQALEFQAQCEHALAKVYGPPTAEPPATNEGSSGRAATNEGGSGRAATNEGGSGRAATNEGGSGRAATTRPRTSGRSPVSPRTAPQLSTLNSQPSAAAPPTDAPPVALRPPSSDAACCATDKGGSGRAATTRPRTSGRSPVQSSKFPASAAPPSVLGPPLSPWPRSRRTWLAIARAMDAHELWFEMGQLSFRRFQTKQPHVRLGLSTVARLLSVANAFGRLATGLDTTQPKDFLAGEGQIDFHAALRRIYGEPELTGPKT